MTTFNVYRREAGDVNPPVAIATGLTSKEYSDITAQSDKSYLYSVGAVVNSIEKMSDEINVIADSMTRIVELNFDGSQSSTTIIDTANSGRLWRSDGAYIDTTQSYSGNSSCRFNGSAYIDTAQDDVLNFEMGDFKLSCAIYPTSDVSGTIITNRDGGARGFVMRREANGSIIFAHIAQTTSVATIAGAAPLNAWSFVELERKGTRLSIRVGEQYAEINNAINGLKSTRRVSIGRSSYDTLRYFIGYIDQLVIAR